MKLLFFLLDYYPHACASLHCRHLSHTFYVPVPFVSFTVALAAPSGQSDDK